MDGQGDETPGQYPCIPIAPSVVQAFFKIRQLIEGAGIETRCSRPFRREATKELVS
jgi:hypothetical protein